MPDKPDVDLARAREFTRRFAAINEMPGEWQELFRSQLAAEFRAVRLEEAKWWHNATNPDHICAEWLERRKAFADEEEMRECKRIVELEASK